MICGRRFGSVALFIAALALPFGSASGRKKEAAPAAVALPFAEDPYPSTYRPLPRADTLIVGATLLDGMGRRLEDADVLMREGRIVAVGQGLDRSGATVIDARRRWVTPGIIDVHSHNGTYVVPLTSIDAKASDVSELGDPNASDTWIEHAVNVQDPAFPRALAGGVTTLQLLPGSTPLFGGRSVVLKTIGAPTVQGMKFPGAPKGLKMACGENPKLEFGAKGQSPTSRQGELAMMRAAFLKARHYLREWKEYAAGEEDDEPQRDLKLDTLVALLNGDMRAHIHCYRSDEMAMMIDLAREFGFRIAAFHHAEEAYKIPRLLRDSGICAAVWADWWGFKMEASDGIRENAAFVDAAGGCAMMHSDSPQMGQWLTIEAAKAAGAGRRAGLSLPPEHVIRWLTSNPARALGLEDRIGTLAPGYNADVVIWSGDPFSVYSHADQVFVDGALAYDRKDPKRQPRSDFELGRPGAMR